MRSFAATTRLPVSAAEAFAWHERPGAFERLNPPWQHVEVRTHTGGIRDGARVHLRVGLAGPIRTDWVLTHRDYVEGRQFRDVQERGPFAHWSHLHLIEPVSENECTLTDTIEYALPFGSLGKMFGSAHAHRTLVRLFAYRHEITREDLALHSRFADRARMRVAISGASGLIGSALCALLSTGGHEVIRLVRRPSRDEREVQWSTEQGIARGDLTKLEGMDAMVHLAGENIGSGRWNKTRMQRIRDSRVLGTRALVNSLIESGSLPKTVIGASAIGYYGDRGDEILDEESTAGTNFLAAVCEDWENATNPLLERDVRIVNARIGIVLSPAGGVLRKMLTPFRLGGGGVIGSGRQWYGWIGLDDCIAAIYHCLMDNELRGPVNLVAPEPVSNRDFTKTLGHALHRPTIALMPAPVARMLFSTQMANETILASTRVNPTRLQQHGFTYRTPTLASTLSHVLGLNDRNASAE